MSLFNDIWAHALPGLKPYAAYYNVVPFGGDVGLIEFVPTTKSLREAEADNVWELLKIYDFEQQKQFLASLVGAYVSVFVLGIEDRHQDNTLVVMHDKTENSVMEIMQIDFAHSLGHRPQMSPDWLNIPLLKERLEKTQHTPEMTMWNMFVYQFVEAFIVLRRTASLIISYCSNIDITFYNGGNPHKWFSDKFRLSLTETQVIEELVKVLGAGSGWKTQVMNWHHAYFMN